MVTEGAVAIVRQGGQMPPLNFDLNCNLDKKCLEVGSCFRGDHVSAHQFLFYAALQILFLDTVSFTWTEEKNLRERERERE